MVAVTLVVPLGAAGKTAPGAAVAPSPHSAFVDPVLVAAMASNPDGVFDVIVQGSHGRSSDRVAADISAASQAAPGRGKGVGRVFQSVAGASAQLTAKQIDRLRRNPNVSSVTLDAPTKVDKYTNDQVWPVTGELPKMWDKAVKEGLKAPTIAVVDSGIQAVRADFGLGTRVVEQVVITQSLANSVGDGRGHGTFVASIAGGQAEKRSGGAPNAPIVSIDVIDDTGAGLVSDVIAAADWILANRTRLGIRVANFSLNAGYPSTFMYDPLTKAVERLWFAGVVVVVSAGNYALDGQPSGVPFSPANDPFVITVGAADLSHSSKHEDDFNAPWSAYGYTLDGFWKPELGAAGRYMIGAVPETSTLVAERPASVVSPGYMQLSGTSFAAPVVASAAAWVLARNPSWGPDQVKGALMLTAVPAGKAASGSLGVGMVQAALASEKVKDPPNPNAALNQFLVPDPNGSDIPVFDAAAWSSTASSDAAWSSAAWSSAAWSSAAWSSAAWSSAAWSSAAWSSAAWSSAAWADAAWASDAAAWANNAVGETASQGELTLSQDELYALELEVGVDLDGDGLVGPPADSTLATP